MTRRTITANNRPAWLDPDAGYVHAAVSPVHAHSCRYWRWGKSHGPCTCGANDQWDALGFGDDPPQGWAGIVAAAILATGGTVLDDPAVKAALADTAHEMPTAAGPCSCAGGVLGTLTVEGVALRCEGCGAEI